jgi:hypothetical protein
VSGDEDVRLAHYRAEARTRLARVPAPSPQPAVPDHETELRISHEGRPTVREQQQEWSVVYP